MARPGTDDLTTPDDSPTANAKTEIWEAFLQIYQAAAGGSRQRIDHHIATDATLWDMDEPQLINGLAELNRARDRRASGDRTIASIAPEPPVIDVWGSTALVRHYFTVTLVTASATERTRVRNTSVWREAAGRWVMVHNHEDVLGTQATSAVKGEAAHG